MSGIVGKNLGRGSGLVKVGAVGADSVTGTSIADDAIDSEHYIDGSIDEAHIANGAVTNAKLGADAVDDTKIGDAKVKKEHINADVAGTGLVGGAGTALAVDGISDHTSGNEIQVEILEIGDWDMDANLSPDAQPVHGLTSTNIRAVNVTIRADDGTISSLERDDGSGAGGQWAGAAVNINLVRLLGGFFDDTSFNSTSYNRGWVTIWYAV